MNHSPSWFLVFRATRRRDRPAKTLKNPGIVFAQAARFYRSTLIYNLSGESGPVMRRMNRNMLLGLAVSFAASIAFWIAIGMLVAMHWR